MIFSSLTSINDLIAPIDLNVNLFIVISINLNLECKTFPYILLCKLLFAHSSQPVLLLYITQLMQEKNA